MSSVLTSSLTTDEWTAILDIQEQIDEGVLTNERKEQWEAVAETFSRGARNRINLLLAQPCLTA